MTNPLTLLPFIEELKPLDFREYTPITVRQVVGATTPNVWKTVYEVTGTGFIRHVFLPSSGSESRGLKITVDGVIVFRSYSQAFLQNRGQGIMDIGTLKWDDYYGRFYGLETYGSAGLPTDSRKEFPYVNASDLANDNGTWCILPGVLPFATSFKVEALNNLTNLSDRVTILGGLK